MKTMDRIFSFFSACVLTLIAILIVRGDQTVPMVRDFPIADQILSPADIRIQFEFNRDMDQQSIESGFRITPHVTGKFSWIGRRMAFTPDTLLESATDYQVVIDGGSDAKGNGIKQPFIGSFRTTDRTFAFVSSEKDEEGRLVIYNWSTKEKRIISPENLFVTSYQYASRGHEIFFLAYDTRNDYHAMNPEDFQAIYSYDLTTGTISEEVGIKGFVNSAFQISPDGHFIAIDRTEVTPNGVFLARNLWLKDNISGSFTKFWYADVQPDVFFFSPDGSHLVTLDQLGFILVPLKEDKSKIQYLGSYSNAHTFDRKGNALVWTDSDDASAFTTSNSLIILASDGEKSVLLDRDGFVEQPTFSFDTRTVYFLQTAEPDERTPLPLTHLKSIDRDSKRLQAITDDPQYLERGYSVSLDEQYILVERFLPGMSAVIPSEIWMRSPDGVWKDLGFRGEQVAWLQ